jgi:serine/threonine protein kinase
MNLDRGTLLHNRYRIVDILGEGGMGAVYRAVDENLGVEVALKENFFTSEEYARQFHREATILASMRHPNLPRVTDHFVIDNQGQYLVMDYMQGEDLRERIERTGILPEDEVIVLGVAICDALTYMHERELSVLHRDIKPGNVKVTPAGEVSLVDFGLAKIVEGNRETTPGARAMTPGYSPPEQYGTARTDPRTDIYSLGATLYEALTGAVPEDGLSRVMEQKALTPVRKRNPDVSRRLAQVLEKALAVKPEERYQTAVDFKRALISATRGSTRKRVIDGGLTVSPPPPLVPTSLDGLEDFADLPDPEPEAPFPISADLSASVPALRPSRTRFRRIGLLIVLLLGTLIGASAGFLCFYQNSPPKPWH